MKGFRTVLFNLGSVLGLTALQFMGGVDWTQYVSPTAAVAIGAGVNIALRVVTTTPIGKK